MPASMNKAPQIRALPTDLDFEKALMFFHAYMYGPVQGKLRLYSARGIPPGTIAMSSDWEVFASMLVKDAGRGSGAGIDLANYEVKSAKRGNAYEYQYHKNSGKEKLAKDMKVGHLFFDYFENLKEVDLRWLHGSALIEYFNKWLENYPDPYDKRYRNSVPYGFVKENGVLLMTLKDGELVYPALCEAEKPIETAKENNELGE
jgi:hypothetical protein